MERRALFLSAVLALGGCMQPGDPEARPSEVALTMTAGEAASVLDLANHPATDRAILDDSIGLDARAAERIVEHRAGPDGISPSADDDLFDDLNELDSVPYVGDTAFVRLRAWAIAHPIPAPFEIEGVRFRAWEADAIVWGVNRSEPAALDAMLDARAARSLVAARPFATVAQIARISYVGSAALARLRTEAPAFFRAMRGGDQPSLAGTFDGIVFDDGTARVALDIANRATHAQLVDNGLRSQGAAPIVGNRPYANLAGVAAVSGVGAATMQDLHDYAASGAWTGGETPPMPPDPDPVPPNPDPVPPDPMPPTPPTNECVFGLSYRDIFTNGAPIIIAQRVLDPASSTNAAQRTQIVAAVQSAYEDVTTVSQAFAAVDDNQINQVEIWDASNRRPYTAYEFGAGDNSYGMVFEYGTTNIAARINDGDLYDCTAMWGNEMRTCERTEDCAEGLVCSGSSETVATGRCLNLRATEHSAEGTECTLESGCPPASGLVCAGATSPWGPGLCRPAWMRGHFESSFEGANIPDASTAGLELELPVFGLATVDTDVLLDLWIDHPRTSDLQITLTNPATAEVVVFDPAPNGIELVLRNHVVLGFSGDEMVNGTWQLRVVDRVSGQTGSVMRFGLTITSRWD